VILIGMLDSPFVRRVAIALKVVGLPFEHRSVSVFRHFDDFATVNPVVKAPTLVAEDGTVLMDSTLILQHVADLAGAGSRLVAQDIARRTRDLRFTGLALAACEKSVQIFYERTLRPPEKAHEPWLARVRGQLAAAYDALEAEIEGVGEATTQAAIDVAVAWRFTHHIVPDVLDPGPYPRLSAHSARMEALPAFASTPLE
jgi:glutathione S-transferase